MYERIKNTTSLIRNRLGIEVGDEPEIGIVLGSGLGMLIQRMEVKASLPYAEIEDFPCSTVVGHQGEFVYGTLSGRRVIAMRGRVHYYEGYSMDQVVLPIRIMCLMGIKQLIVSNAAGGVNNTFKVGDIMIIKDHINLLPNPLIGPNIEQFGTRFPSMTQCYSHRLRQVAKEVALSMEIEVRQGVYAALSGPTYETLAEYKYLHTIGADASGMSTTPEVIVARHMGVEVFGMSLISNMGLGNNIDVPNHDDVFRAASKASQTMSQMVEKMIAAF